MTNTVLRFFCCEVPHLCGRVSLEAENSHWGERSSPHELAASHHFSTYFIHTPLRKNSFKRRSVSWWNFLIFHAVEKLYCLLCFHGYFIGKYFNGKAGGDNHMINWLPEWTQSLLNWIIFFTQVLHIYFFLHILLECVVCRPIDNISILCIFIIFLVIR